MVRELDDQEELEGVPEDLDPIEPDPDDDLVRELEIDPEDAPALDPLGADGALREKTARLDTPEQAPEIVPERAPEIVPEQAPEIVPGPALDPPPPTLENDGPDRRALPHSDRRRVDEEPTGDPIDAESTIAVLLVEHDQLAAERLFEVLSNAPTTRFEVTHVANVDDALQKLQEASYDVMLLDLSIEEGYGLESLYRARVAAATVPIVVLTYQSDVNLALKATRAGAQDYLIKGEVTPALITRSLAHAVERHSMLQDLREAQQRQWFLANHDPLTSLQNRSALLKAAHATIEKADRKNSRVAFLFIDLDGFKPVNDNLGHAAGDELLADVAGRLRRMRPRRDLVARLGGDEFVVVAVDPPEEDSPERIAEEIRDEIEKAYVVGGGVECFVSASIGVSVFPDDGTDAEELIRHADTAMYASKAAGRNAVTCFESEMDDHTQQRFALVNSLREAIRGGELLLEFQPQIEVATEEIIGAETLVRWKHPTRGVVAPSEFIGVAEDTGMMVPLGEWVLKTACAAAASWKTLTSITVAVNISGRQLEQRDFPGRVRAILEESGLPPSRLELELTETLAARDSTLQTLAGLRELGVRVAIDDFGTGYSSFTLLKKLPADLLKIDQSFVRDAMNQDSGVVILDAILRMARGLGVAVVAEGVETLEEMDLLLGLGCHLMQGYLLGKPVPKSEFEALMIAPDAGWRMPIQRPEAWAPLSREELNQIPAAPAPGTPEDVDIPDPDELGDDALPAIRD